MRRDIEVKKMNVSNFNEAQKPLPQSQNPSKQRSSKPPPAIVTDTGPAPNSPPQHSPKPMHSPLGAFANIGGDDNFGIERNYGPGQMSPYGS